MIRKFSFFLLITLIGALSAQAESVPLPSPAPTPIKEWKSYSNAEYGFSFSYPRGNGVEDIGEMHGNTFGEFQINVPTYFGHDGIAFLAFTDSTIQKWNDMLDKNGYSGDEEKVDLPLAKMRQYLALLPLGSAIRDLPGAQVTEMVGKKAICFSSGPNPNDGNKSLFYYISLGGTRWIAIDINYLDYVYDREKDENVLRPEAFRRKEKAAQDAILNTIKFFEPTEVVKQKLSKPKMISATPSP